MSVIKADLSKAVWQHSPESNLDEPHIEIAFLDEGNVALRNSHEPDGTVLIYTPAEWEAFVLGARDGEFDLPEDDEEN